MYNSIYPVNINYRKGNSQNKSESTSSAENSQTLSQETPKDTFPNGTKVSIDYSKGQINISQVLADFRNTIIAINAPDDIKDEVYLYLDLVDRESKKDEPSKDIVVSNLKNASKISDTFITKSLNKKSNVVEGWINALFLQNINLKANPDEINPDFQLNFPNKPENNDKPDEISIDNQEENIEEEFNIDETQDEIEQIDEQTQKTDNSVILSDSTIVESISDIEYSDDNFQTIQTSSHFSSPYEIDNEAKNLFVQAKHMPQGSKGDTDAVNLLNEALGLLENSQNANGNIKAAIHFERGKIFDAYDYVDYALRDFHEAKKADDLNLKAQAYYKSGQIYDEFSEFSPALDNYLTSVAFCGEADNFNAQTTVLNKISNLYTKQYDTKSASDFSDLAIDSAVNTQDDKVIAKTYSNAAQNYQFLGENYKALDNYKNSLKLFSRNNESFEQMAFNYEQAALVMEKLGNKAKAEKLQLKAHQYYQLSQQQQEQQELAS